jgi:hypothetical protein
MVALLYFTLCLAVLQTLLLTFLGQAVQTATNVSAREMRTGQTTADTQAQFWSLVCGNLPQPLFSCSNLMVDVQEFPNFSSMVITPVTPTYTVTTNALGQKVYTLNTGAGSYSQSVPGEVVVVRVLYNWPVVAGSLLGLSNQPNGAFLMEGTAVFQNEPYFGGLTS